MIQGAYYMTITLTEPTISENLLKKAEKETEPYLIYAVGMRSSEGNEYILMHAGTNYKKALNELIREDAQNSMVRYDGEKLTEKERREKYNAEKEKVADDFIVIDTKNKTIIN